MASASNPSIIIIIVEGVERKKEGASTAPSLKPGGRGRGSGCVFMKGIQEDEPARPALGLVCQARWWAHKAKAGGWRIQWRNASGTDGEDGPCAQIPARILPF